MRYISTTKVAIATKLCQTMAKLIYYIFKLEERRQLKPKAYELQKPFKLNQLFQNFSYEAEKRPISSSEHLSKK